MTKIFKTNIKCNGCINAVSPVIDHTEGLVSWKVDLQDSERKLTIEGDIIDWDLLIEKLKQLGYHLEPVQP
jgi:copper chaperone